MSLVGLLALSLVASTHHGAKSPRAAIARDPGGAGAIRLAGPNTPQVPVRLTGPADVVQLCRHLTGLIDGPPAADPVASSRQQDQAQGAQKKARDEIYEVRLPPREFSLGHFDPQGETLDVGGRLTAGHGLLDLAPNEVALELDASPEEASQAYQLWHAGKGSLRVTFDIDDQVTCEGSPQSPPWLLAVRLISIGFVDEQGQLLLDGANSLATHGDKAGSRPRAPGIAIDAVVSLDGHIDPARVAVSLQDMPGLQQCYARFLGATPQLEGTVVFQARTDAHGRPTELQVALEDLGVPDLVSCLGDSIKMATLAGTSAGARMLLPLELRRL